jgi:N-acetylglucosaminyl-diphospho-decaprenol L-rhamnosyltransferase
LNVISISVVSHGQAALVDHLLHDIESNCRAISFELILTLNLEEILPFAPDSFSFPIKVIHNTNPMGFAANHNQAFAHATGQYFCVLNPDVRFRSDPFPSLLECLKNPLIGVAAPVVLGEGGEIEDSARHFPTPLKIICKAIGGCKGVDYAVKDELVFPDWAGGMFMLFPRFVFERLGGFDQRYFLYYEDVDLCARLRLLGYEVALCPAASVIHHAHRSSHRNLKYLKWHLTSMLRFFFSPVYWRVQLRKWL